MRKTKDPPTSWWIISLEKAGLLMTVLLQVHFSGLSKACKDVTEANGHNAEKLTRSWNHSLLFRAIAETLFTSKGTGSESLD